MEIKPKNKGKLPEYSKIFSNLATPMEDPTFVDDDRDPFEELKSMPSIRSSKHIIVDFDIGLNEIKDAAPRMKEVYA